MSKHTSKPWTLNRRAFMHLQNGDIIAESFSRPFAECEANARLIVAAPYLLEACHMMDKWITAQNQDAPDIEELTLETVMEHVESAIRKATGKTL